MLSATYNVPMNLCFLLPNWWTQPCPEVCVCQNHSEKMLFPSTSFYKTSLFLFLLVTPLESETKRDAQGFKVASVIFKRR